MHSSNLWDYFLTSMKFVGAKAEPAVSLTLCCCIIIHLCLRSQQRHCQTSTSQESYAVQAPYAYALLRIHMHKQDIHFHVQRLPVGAFLYKTPVKPEHNMHKVCQALALHRENNPDATFHPGINLLPQASG